MVCDSVELSVTANTHDPVMMGHLIEVFDLRFVTSHSEGSEEDSDTNRRKQQEKEVSVSE